MQTLADLKRECAKYEFKLVSNSWYQSVPDFQSAWRKVARVQSGKFTLLTYKEKDKEPCESWIDFPKASELKLHYLGKDNYQLLISRDCGNDQPLHVMNYELRLGGAE